MYRISPVGWRTETENNITSLYTKLRVITLSDEISRWKCQSKKKKSFCKQHVVQVQHSLPWKTAEAKSLEGLIKQFNKYISGYILGPETSKPQTRGKYAPISACGSRSYTSQISVVHSQRKQIDLCYNQLQPCISSCLLTLLSCTERGVSDILDNYFITIA